MNLPTSRTQVSWRFPVWLALAGVIGGGLLDFACPRTAEPSEPPAIKISVDKHRGFGPLKIRIRTVALNHPDNRFVCIWVDGPLRATSSCHPHTAESLSERTLVITLPEGVYLLWATVLRTENRVISSGVIEVEVL